MQSEKAISFRQTRDVGEIITATFTYLRQNWRSLGQSLLYIMGPVLAVQLVISSQYQQTMFGMMDGSEPATPDELAALYGEMLWPMLMLLPVALLVVVLAVTVVYVHMQIYQKHGPASIRVGDVWMGVKRVFGRMAGTVLATFLAGVGAMIVVVMVGALVAGGLGASLGPVGAGLGMFLMMLGFVAVGAYLMVLFALLFPVRMYEDVSLTGAFQRCLHLLEGVFWQSLGVVFVVVVLYYVMAMAFSMPASVLGAIWGFNSANGAGSTLFQVALVAANVVGGIGSTAAYCIPVIAAGLYYFGLVEKKEHAGLAARVKQVGERAGEHEAVETEERTGDASFGSAPGKGANASEGEQSSGETQADEAARWRPGEQT